MNATDSLEQLGKEIVARIELAKKARDKADDHERAAGLRLIEAHDKTGATFPDFLQKFCPSLKKSRAYQLIAIVGGKTTVDAERSKTAERVRKHRAAKAATPKAAPTDSPLRNGQASGDTAPVDSQQQFLNEVSYFVRVWFPKMNAATLAKAKAIVAAWEPARVQEAA